jgi:tRNA (guanine26-N2/guanine27-N2)-dimethyltransferase
LTETCDFRPDFPTNVAEEGKVRLVVPKLEAFIKSPSEYAPSKAPVFYNPIMELNRDIAVLALQAYQRTIGRDLTVCEPLAGCGVMGIRFAAEVEGVGNVVMGDINENASRLAELNIHMNNLGEKVSIHNEEANFLLSQHNVPHKRFDVVNIDPFGSPVPYLDSAIRALRNNGLLAVTATDMAPLCGVHPKACLRKYGGRPLRTEYCHELAVRLLVGCLAATAARHDIGINVLFSHSTDHYARVYATICYGAKKADESIGRMGYVQHCFNCLHRETTRRIFLVEGEGTCCECGAKMTVAGPLWLDMLANKAFCDALEKETEQKLLKRGERIGKILALVRSEIGAQTTYYVVDELCHKLGSPVPSVKKVAKALEDAGFKACFTHFDPLGVRTDASASKMKEILRGILSTNG